MQRLPIAYASAAHTWPSVKVFLWQGRPRRANFTEGCDLSCPNGLDKDLPAKPHYIFNNLVSNNFHKCLLSACFSWTYSKFVVLYWKNTQCAAPYFFLSFRKNTLALEDVFAWTCQIKRVVTHKARSSPRDNTYFPVNLLDQTCNFGRNRHETNMWIVNTGINYVLTLTI